MKIQKDHIVTLHYIVKTTEGDVLDSSHEAPPMAFLQGSHFMIEGIEEALLGKAKGDKFSITVDPDKAYGDRHDSLVQEVPSQMFEGTDVEVGMSFRATTDDGEQSVLIIDKTDTTVTVDGNHPLAGRSLAFDIEVVDVREASSDELAHGHVHGEGGCGHAH
jgi:FKBP-type peptidyl-prolyl cis-trans isomerase SlyD